MKIAILGAGGFLGQNLGLKLANDGHQVTGYVLDPSKIAPGFECQSVYSLIETSAAIAPKFDVTINLAARRSTVSAPLSDDQVNEFTFEIPKRFFLKTAAVDTVIVNMSTYIQNFAGDRGRTVDSYGAAKERLSNFLETYSPIMDFKTRDLFFFTLYGVGDRPNHLVPLLLEAAKTGNQRALSPGHQLMNLLYIDDAVQNILNCISLLDETPYRKSFVWDQKYFSVRDLVSTIESVIGKKINCAWGGRDYAGHEMMNPWPIPMEQLTGFMNPTNLNEGILKLWQLNLAND